MRVSPLPLLSEVTHVERGLGRQIRQDVLLEHDGDGLDEAVADLLLEELGVSDTHQDLDELEARQGVVVVHPGAGSIYSVKLRTKVESSLTNSLVYFSFKR